MDNFPSLFHYYFVLYEFKIPKFPKELFQNYSITPVIPKEYEKLLVTFSVFNYFKTISLKKM